MSRNVIYNLDGVTRYVNDKYVDVIWTDKVCYCKDCKYVSHITILVNPRTTKCEALTVSLSQSAYHVGIVCDASSIIPHILDHISAHKKDNAILKFCS